MATLGEKIKYFRKRAGKSQMDVEISTGMAAGQLSRIENGEVNPTKETLKKISDILELNLIEELFLDGAYALPVDLNSPQVKTAIADVSNILNDPLAFAYITDDRFRLLEFSEGLRHAFKFDNTLVRKIRGCNILECMFDIENPVNPFLQTSDYDRLCKFQISRFKKQVSYWPIDEYSLNLIESLKGKNPEFKRYWNEPEIDTYVDDTRVVAYKINGREVRLYYSREQLKKNLRLYVVIYQKNSLLSQILNSSR